MPLDAVFRDETGRQLTLGDLITDRPVVIAPVYFECPMLCTLVLEGFVKALRPLGFEPGEEFDVVGTHMLEGLDWIKLEPTGGSDFASISIGFSGTEPRRLELVDGLGQVTRIELDHLVGSLERLRATFRWKADDLDTAGLRTRIGASSLTLGGLLKHLALVEDHTFTAKLHGEPIGAPWDATEHDGVDDWEFFSADNDSPEDLYRYWDSAVFRSRSRLAAALGSQMMMMSRPSPPPLGRVAMGSACGGWRPREGDAQRPSTTSVQLLHCVAVAVPRPRRLEVSRAFLSSTLEWRLLCEPGETEASPPPSMAPAGCSS